ncbi:hypothetical protein DL240_14530 [Lujinxingia litoralis]|uniref:Methyltransferase domain-containing protein n=1 Tax=Lujinxingia litoralis TaxID=2211119 RepID=A0A328C514_9DELT|nr:class I SAM-dependent methyltransferase [Lujinxingia litoralis]RAL20896.1 hypothetical protein DL240_14530 [Lujinxingia litoralis]
MNFSGYDSFADIYDRFWAGDSARRFGPIILERVGTRLKKGARVLDLCCGSGRFTHQLLDQGFDAYGVDNSKELLRLARERGRPERFFLSDVRELNTNVSGFELVICVYDSLNHMLLKEDLRAVFRGVRDVLDPGGLFVFDYNTEAKYRFHWKGQMCFEHDRSFLAVNASTMQMNGMMRAAFDGTLFSKVGELWQREDFALEQRPIGDAEISDLLAELGFAPAEFISLDHDDSGRSLRMLVETRKT